MSTATGFSDAVIQTSTGAAITTTVWLPLSTAYPYVSGCSQDIYKPGGGSIFAWDPLFGATIQPASTGCLPREVTSSYWQASLSQTSITTLLGPTFVCPAAYSAVLTLAINSYTQQTLCCPSSFTLNVPLTTGGFPSQCVSSITSGQAVTYLTASGGASAGQWKTTTVTPGATTMLAIHVNGYNVIASSTGSSSSSSQTSTSASSSSSSSSTSATSASSSKSSGLSSGAAAGIGVGATLFVILAALAAFLLYRRRKRAGSRVPMEDTNNDYTQAEQKGGFRGDYDPWIPPRPQEVHGYSPHEMESSSSMRLNELPVKEVRHEMAAS